MRAADFRADPQVDIQRVGACGVGLPDGTGVRPAVHGLQGEVSGGVGRGDGRALVGEVDGEIGAERVAAGAVGRIEGQFADAEWCCPELMSLNDEAVTGLVKTRFRSTLVFPFTTAPGIVEPGAAVPDTGLLNLAEGKGVIYAGEDLRAAYFHGKREIHNGRVPWPVLRSPSGCRFRSRRRSRRKRAAGRSPRRR